MKPGGFSLPHRARQAKSKAANCATFDSPSLDIFAELLSQDIPPRVAARQMGLAQDTGDRMLQRLRQMLGPQAV